MAGIKPTFVYLSDIYWSDKDKDWILIVKGYGFQLLSCLKDIPHDILIDQAYRNLYFDYGFNVIYSRYFFKNGMANQRYCGGYNLKGFFREKEII